MWVYGLDWAGPGQGQVADACECGNEPSGSMKCGEFLDKLQTSQLLKKDSAPLSKQLHCSTVIRVADPNPGSYRGAGRLAHSAVIQALSGKSPLVWREHAQGRLYGDDNEA